MSKKVGLDIGYSNVIAVYSGDSGNQESIVRPARATPLNALPRDSGLRAGEVIVEVDGQPWVAFAGPGRAGDRELHKDYTASDYYQALFKGALLNAACNSDVVDTLVTGLPVSQFHDKSYVRALKERMTGRHRISPKIEIDVRQVEVVPQPVGTLTDVYCTSEHAEVIEESVVLVIDPGFFSVDWIVFIQRELATKTSNSSLKAMSVLLETCAEEVALDFGGNPGTDKIEWALQEGKNSIMLFGRKVDLPEYLKRASDRVIPTVMREIKQELRKLENQVVDCVILGGGGASLYESYARQEFPSALILCSSDIIRSNAQGFWHIAHS
ncbi:ParM/StbA family protein [Azotobacter salinestris]|uniref:ParM/StbA family protein n=1 Tax=Azotobacter salinestris TaxID=69964 RepID=UPI0032DED0DC